MCRKGNNTVVSHRDTEENGVMLMASLAVQVTNQYI